jgi:hypothetical protein
MMGSDEGGMSCEQEDVGSVCSRRSFKKQCGLPILDGSGTKETKFGQDPARTFEND